MAAATGSPRKSIKDVFYETRVLMGREYTVRRFAAEVLGGTIDPVMLGYIEKGKRFPSEALVRRQAAIRKEDPHPLLALLWRDRILHAFGKELRRVLHAPRGVAGVEDAVVAVLVRRFLEGNGGETRRDVARDSPQHAAQQGRDPQHPSAAGEVPRRAGNPDTQEEVTTRRTRAGSRSPASSKAGARSPWMPRRPSTRGSQ